MYSFLCFSKSCLVESKKYRFLLKDELFSLFLKYVSQKKNGTKFINVINESWVNKNVKLIVTLSSYKNKFNSFVPLSKVIW